MEFQKRGAPHFHVFLNGRVNKEALRDFWYKIAHKGDKYNGMAAIKVEKVRKPWAAGCYAAKYAKKAEQKTVPPEYHDVGRFWGTFGGVRADPVTGHTGHNSTAMAQRVRALKKLHSAQMAKKGFAPRKADKGRVGFTLYGVAETAYLETFLLSDPHISGTRYMVPIVDPLGGNSVSYGDIRSDPQELGIS